MKSVILTSDALEHRYVANALSAALGNHLVGVIVEERSPLELNGDRLARIRKRYGYLGILERLTTKVTRKLLRQTQRKNQALRQVLGSTAIDLKVDCPVIGVPSVSSPQSLACLGRLEPDYLFVYSTSVVRKRALSTAGRASLNLHTGISPFYRGSGTVFWPLYNNEPWMVGSTVHECTSRLDGGHIYKQVHVRLVADDDQYSAFAKCVRDGAGIYAEVAKRLAEDNDIEGSKQDLNNGREYFFRDLTFVQEVVMEWRIRSGGLRRLIARNSHQADAL